MTKDRLTKGSALVQVTVAGALPALELSAAVEVSPGVWPERFELLRWPGECRLIGSDGEWLGLGIDEDWITAVAKALGTLPPPESWQDRYG